MPYFDLSFQHAAPTVLRRMRRFGDPDAFLELLGVDPGAGARGRDPQQRDLRFPGETDAELEILRDFLIAADLDVIGVFGYSDEDGTEAARLPGQLPAEEIEARRQDLADLADELIAQRAEARIGELVEVLVEDTEDAVVGRADHQGPEVDGTTTIMGGGAARIGEIVSARVCGSEGADLIADAVDVVP